MFHRVYIGLGSNLDSPLAQVNSACQQITEHPGFVLLKHSRWYRSRAVGPGEQADYVNGAVLVETPLEVEAVLDALHEIENQHGRRRELRWGPRTLDLDILLFDNCVVSTERLTIPHHQLSQRNFVLQPLLDIDPDLTLPDGRKIAEILHIIGTQDLQEIGDYLEYKARRQD